MQIVVKFFWIVRLYAGLFFQLFGGKKRMFSKYLRVTGRWRKMLGSFPTCFDPNVTLWCRVMANGTL